MPSAWQLFNWIQQTCNEHLGRTGAACWEVQELGGEEAGRGGVEREAHKQLT